MKSSSIGTDDQRRLRVLRALVQEDFALYVIVVDKQALTSPGFKYPKSLVKYSLDSLISEMLKDFTNPFFHCDNMKNESFRQEFLRYMKSCHPIDAEVQLSLSNYIPEEPPNTPWQFDFEDSASDPCIQAADVIAGSIARYYEPDKRTDDTAPFLKTLKPHTRYFRLFPTPSSNDNLHPPPATRHTHDSEIRLRALQSAHAHVERFQHSSDLLRRAQVECLRALLAHDYLQCGNDWIQTGVLRTRVKSVYDVAISDQRLRSIIGSLRDLDILIASRHAGGYRLPICEADLEQFLTIQNSQVVPMLSRIDKARKQVKRATDGVLDILDQPDFATLKTAIDAIGHWPPLPEGEDE